MGTDANGYDFRKECAAFCASGFVHDLKDKPKWTISDKNKMPVDMGELAHGRIKGALQPAEPYTTTLDRCLEIIPNPANHAFYLDVTRDNYVVLDIEPTCPERIKRTLLELDFQYAETSMSGKGMHLVFPCPRELWDNPIARSKVVLKQRDKYYEILLNHWVTFTHNALDVKPGNRPFAKLFEAMCATQEVLSKADTDINADEPDDIPDKDFILYILTGGSEYRKTPADFNGDVSKYEFGMAGFLYRKLLRVLKTIKIRNNGHTYTDNEKAWLIYYASLETLEHRDKHDQRRDGMPMLLYNAKNAIALAIAADAKKKEQTDKD